MKVMLIELEQGGFVLTIPQSIVETLKWRDGDSLDIDIVDYPTGDYITIHADNRNV